MGDLVDVLQCKVDIVYVKELLIRTSIVSDLLSIATH